MVIDDGNVDLTMINHPKMGIVAIPLISFRYGDAGDGLPLF